MELERIARETPHDVLVSRRNYHMQCAEASEPLSERYNYHTKKIVEFTVALEKIRS
jgi:hypothetical protein